MLVGARLRERNSQTATIGTLTTNPKTAIALKRRPQPALGRNREPGSLELVPRLGPLYLVAEADPQPKIPASLGGHLH